METLTRTTVVPPAAKVDVRPIRPCMVSFYFHPDYSGSAIQALNLSRHLAARNVEPMIVSANLSSADSTEQIAGIPVHRLPILSGKELQIPSFSVALLDFLVRNRDRYDVIHAHGTLQHGAASLAGRWLGKPTILKVAMAESDIAFHRQGRLRGRINRALVSGFTAYIATTPAIAEEFVARGLDPTKVHLIPNGVDTDVFAPVPQEQRAALRRSLGLPDAPLAAYVGIINQRKNVDGALRIWRAVCAEHSSAHLVLVGPTQGEADPFYRQVKGFIAESNLGSRVTIAGFKDPVLPYLQAADAFLFPSRREGMANSVLEAMSCAVPCLVSNAAGVAEIIRHEVNGFALDVDDEAGFARILSLILNDLAIRDTIGAEARQTILAQLSLHETAARYCELYRSLLGNN